MRSEESIAKEVKSFLIFKVLVIVASLSSCILLLSVFTSWPLTQTLLICGTLLVVVGLCFIVSMLETAAHASSTNDRSAMVNACASANIGIAFAWLSIAATAVAAIYRVL